ncbi:hypothetical protein E8E14_003047 [Neopestalotiopsis sp. 37M]|nr:hypothetical protein E8E14_003047 [Neopestalotiopsis sp. 37M]
MAWYSSALPVPPEISSLIGWLVFSFKMMSLFFAGPLIALILFDICLWIWRLIRGALPQGTSPSASASKPAKLSRQHSPQTENTMKNANTTSTDTKLLGGDPRKGYAATVST